MIRPLRDQSNAKCTIQAERHEKCRQHTTIDATDMTEVQVLQIGYDPGDGHVTVFFHRHHVTDRLRTSNRVVRASERSECQRTVRLLSPYGSAGY